MSEMDTIYVFADGSSTGKKTGPIGWGWVIVNTSTDKILHVGASGALDGTNNIAELQAAIYGLKCAFDLDLHKTARVVLVSDSQYCLKMATGAANPTCHFELIRSLQYLMSATNAKAQWVKGHADNDYNVAVDKLAKAGKKKFTGGDNEL